jgi:flagellar protein FlaG
MANNEVLVQSGLQSLQTHVTGQSKPTSQPVQTAPVTELSAAKESAVSQNPELQREQQQERTDVLREKVAQLNDHMQNLNRSLQFSVDEQSGDTVVKVVDADTEEVVRQIPSEAILRARNAIEKYRGILLEIQA